MTEPTVERFIIRTRLCLRVPVPETVDDYDSEASDYLTELVDTEFTTLLGWRIRRAERRLLRRYRILAQHELLEAPK